jgi:hypothetical protein
VPIPLQPDMPHRMMLQSESEDGQVLGYVLHQYRDTHPGFDARLAVYWPRGAPDEMVNGHVDHLDGRVRQLVRDVPADPQATGQTSCRWR